MRKEMISIRHQSKINQNSDRVIYKCSTSPKVVMFLKILTCCALYLVQVVYNIAGANGGNYLVPAPET
jgi:hypothetical protein